MNETAARAPLHLWIIGVVSLLWNAIGAFDYTATELRLDFYMKNFTQAQLDYFYSAPAWMIGFWAIGVWGALLGSLGLLLRKAWATWMFALSILGLVGTTLYNYVLTDGLEIMGPAAIYLTALIWVIAIFLLLYSRSLAARKVLT